jgi:hypothetical protein
MLLAEKRIELEIIMVSKISQSQKDTCSLSYVEYKPKNKKRERE